MTPSSQSTDDADRQVVPHEWLPALRTLHETIAERLSFALTKTLQRSTAVLLTSVDEITHGQFVYSLERPTFICRLGSGDLPHKLALEINHSILFPLLDRLLGGDPTGGAAYAPHRPLTAIECRLAARVVAAIVETLTTAWSKDSQAAQSAEICLTIERLESDPALTPVADDDERVVLVSFEVALGAARGLLNLCVPWPAIVALVGQQPEPFVPDMPTAEETDACQSVATRPSGTLIELVVEVDAGHVSIEDLQALSVGDIITTAQAAADPLIATIDGAPRFLVRPGSLGGQKAVEVQRAIDDPVDSATRRAG